ncbi:hypothetical protein [uncultured Stenotrophomonas sp.]|uniref:hypothetical protein n=1 Tax=uncultured Stenotrophomonas sp. TaxID=165438 RepID=UPI0028EB531B|nr:hypothetical protein [uncultured Stenotrophomonas sp.]
MTSTDPTAPALSLEDQSQLRLLSIFHYVVAGLTALFSLFPLIHVGIGIATLSGAMPINSNGGPASPDETRLFGWLFIVIGSIVILCGLTLAGFMAYAGRCLARQRRHTLCVVVAALSCMCMPLGTVLGVFTLVVLMRPAVKAAFHAPPTAQP